MGSGRPSSNAKLGEWSQAACVTKISSVFSMAQTGTASAEAATSEEEMPLAEVLAHSRGEVEEEVEVGAAELIRSGGAAADVENYVLGVQPAAAAPRRLRPLREGLEEGGRKREGER